MDVERSEIWSVLILDNLNNYHYIYIASTDAPKSQYIYDHEQHTRTIQVKELEQMLLRVSFGMKYSNTRRKKKTLYNDNIKNHSMISGENLSTLRHIAAGKEIKEYAMEIDYASSTFEVRRRELD